MIVNRSIVSCFPLHYKAAPFFPGCIFIVLSLKNPPSSPIIILETEVE